MAHIALAGYLDIKEDLPKEYTDVLSDCKSMPLFVRYLRSLHSKKRNLKLLNDAQRKRLTQCVEHLDQSASEDEWTHVLETGGKELLDKFAETSPSANLVQSKLDNGAPVRSPRKTSEAVHEVKKQAASNAGKQKIRYTATVDKDRFAKLADIIRNLNKPKVVSATS